MGCCLWHNWIQCKPWHWLLGVKVIRRQLTHLCETVFSGKTRGENRPHRWTRKKIIHMWPSWKCSCLQWAQPSQKNIFFISVVLSLENVYWNVMFIFPAFFGAECCSQVKQWHHMACTVRPCTCWRARTLRCTWARTDEQSPALPKHSWHLVDPSAYFQSIQWDWGGGWWLKGVAG